MFQTRKDFEVRLAVYIINIHRKYTASSPGNTQLHFVLYLEWACTLICLEVYIALCRCGV